MTHQHLEKQIGFFMAITFVVLEAALLMVQKLQRMLEEDHSSYSFEAKKHFNGLKDAWDKVRIHLEYFELAIMPSMVTSDGKTDTCSVYDALAEDGYDIARIVCRIFNAKVSTDRGFSEIENAVKQFEVKEQRIDDAVIESLRLNS